MATILGNNPFRFRYSTNSGCVKGRMSEGVLWGLTPFFNLFLLFQVRTTSFHRSKHSFLCFSLLPYNTHRPFSLSYGKTLTWVWICLKKVWQIFNTYSWFNSMVGYTWFTQQSDPGSFPVSVGYIILTCHTIPRKVHQLLSATMI